MNSNILNSLGLGTLDPGIIIIVLFVFILILLIICIFNMIKIGNLTKKYKYFMKGKSSKNLETEIFQIIDENQKIQEVLKDYGKNLRSLNRQICDGYQKMSLIKYDAYEQMGGKLSFCLALLDKYDNGVILNNVYVNNNSYVYAKEVRSGQSEIELTHEEQEALESAIGNGI